MNPVWRRNILLTFTQRDGKSNEINKNEFVEGYDEVLSNLEHAHANEFTITGIDSAHGAYLIFSDLERNNLIGVLKSKRTLTEIRKKYSDHEALVGHENMKYGRTEHVFY